MQIKAKATFNRMDDMSMSAINAELKKKLLIEIENQMPMLIINREDGFDGTVSFTAFVTLEVNR